MMPAWIRRIVSPPVPKDEDAARTAGLLHVILLVMLVLASLSLVISVATSTGQVWRVPAFLVTLLSLIGLKLQHHIHVRVLGGIFVTLLWLHANWIVILAGSISHFSVSIYLVVILTGGLLLGGRAAVILMTLSIAASGLIGLAEINGFLRPSEAEEILINWAALASNLIMATVILVLALHGWRDALGRAHRLNRDLRAEIERGDALRAEIERGDALRESLRHEIVEREKAEEKLREQAAELMLRNAELEQLSYTVSQDLKSPLVTIKGFLKLLHRDIDAGDKETLLRDVGFISSAVEVVEQRHADLLQLTRRGQLFSKLLRAQSPAHLAALREEIREIEAAANGEERPAPALERGFLGALRQVVDGLEPLELLPSGEDRAHAIGEALTRALALQEAHKGEGSTVAPALDDVALASVRRIFTTALQDLGKRAELELRLLSKRVTARREAVVVLEVCNVGKGHARNLSVELAVDPANARALVVRQGRQHVKNLAQDQAARLEFLVERRHSEPVRLTFHVTWDDLERPGKELDFADVMELSPVREPGAFRPLRPNPYVVGRPLLDEDPFYGREELFARLAASFEGGGQDNVVVLIGQRRMGKTSILRRLGRHIPKAYVPVLVDLQALLATGDPAFFREVTFQVTDSLYEHGIEVPEPDEGAFDTDPGRFFRQSFLGGVRRALNGRRLLLIFDELEVLEERIRTGDLTPWILPYLRSLIQHEDGVSFMLAGTHRLDELTADYWGALFNLAIYQAVGHLSRADVDALLTTPTHRSFEIDSLALEKVYRMTGGHPHFSQLIARELVELCNRHQIAYVTMRDVNRVIDVVVDKGQLHIAYLWDDASRDERLLLLTAKDLLAGEGTASLEAVRRYLDQRRIAPGDLAPALQSLRRKEILAEEDGRLSFRIDLLRGWLDRHQGLDAFEGRPG